MPDEKHPEFWASAGILISKVGGYIFLILMGGFTVLAQNYSSANPVHGWKAFWLVVFAVSLGSTVTYTVLLTGHEVTASVAGSVSTLFGRHIVLFFGTKGPGMLRRIKKISFWGAVVDLEDDEDDKKKT